MCVHFYISGTIINFYLLGLLLNFLQAHKQAGRAYHSLPPLRVVHSVIIPRTWSRHRLFLRPARLGCLSNTSKETRGALPLNWRQHPNSELVTKHAGLMLHPFRGQSRYRWERKYNRGRLRRLTDKLYQKFPSASSIFIEFSFRSR